MSADFLLYGATGYTGQLIVREAVARGLRPILGGRRAATLAPLAEQWGLPTAVFAIDDAPARDRALAGVRVLLNGAGPFATTAPPLVEGCLRTGTTYLDLAGEVPEFEALAQFDEQAKAAGAMLMPGVGFGVVPTDCLALHLKERLPSATHLTLAFETVGGASQGTARTLLLNLHRSGVVRRNGRLEPAAPAATSRPIDFGAGVKQAVANPWRGDLVTAFHSTGIPNVETFSAFPAPIPLLMRVSPAIGGLWGSGPWQRALDGLIGRLPVGPSDAEIEAGATHVWGEVRDAQGQSQRARLHGPEAYRFTVLTALAVIERALAGDAPPGFQTPAQAYGPDFVLELPGVTRVAA